MSLIKINNVEYKIHPIYDLYGSDNQGNIINIVKKNLKKSDKFFNGYYKCLIRFSGRSGYKSMFSHYFIWECFYDLIPSGKTVIHINGNKKDNRLCNLELISEEKKVKISKEDRDYSFVSNNHKNRRCIKAINQDKNEIKYYFSIYAVNKHLGINPGIIKMVCENSNNCKSGISKFNNHRYKFEYINESDMPEEDSIRPKRVSNEEKMEKNKARQKIWREKQFTCSICNQSYKNAYKYIHNKKCNYNQ